MPVIARILLAHPCKMRTLVSVPVVPARLGDSTGQHWLYKLLCCRAVIRCQGGSAGYGGNVMLTAIPIHTQTLNERSSCASPPPAPAAASPPSLATLPTGLLLRGALTCTSHSAPSFRRPVSRDDDFFYSVCNGTSVPECARGVPADRLADNDLT